MISLEPTREDRALYFSWRIAIGVAVKVIKICQAADGNMQ
jgi:hypothetical protein